MTNQMYGEAATAFNLKKGRKAPPGAFKINAGEDEEFTSFISQQHRLGFYPGIREVKQAPDAPGGHVVLTSTPEEKLNVIRTARSEDLVVVANRSYTELLQMSVPV